MLKRFLISLLSSLPNSISSKRLCGVLGWLTVIIVLLYCTITAVLAPLMIDAFMFCCMGLLGIDSITSIWKRRP